MLRSTIITLSVWACTLLVSQAQQTYDDHGFSFQHSEAEKVTVTGDKIKTVRVENANGSLFMLQNYGKSITPEQLRSMMTESLLKQFEKNATELKHKSATRTLFGEARSGSYILFSKNNIPSESLLFTFQKDGDTICVITQMALQHSKEAERMFATIQESLSISKK
ncbi:hypothetical protein [Rubritalea tangerina]|uniref:DUF1795 domain-containing protein n=1 Tax=Rubritalea tangerina TaxID=430798 RepID=A0ABW4ZB38_9BACT